MDDEIELLGAAFDYDYDDDDDELGARGRLVRRGGRSIRRSSARRMAYARRLVPKIPGTPAAGARNFPLGFGVFTFVNEGVTVAILTASPQRPFKGARLVVDVRRSAGALAELVSITSLNVGQNNQLVSGLALPAEAFVPNSFQTSLSLDPATPGIDISIGLAISAAPGVGETVSVSAMLIGNTIG